MTSFPSRLPTTACIALVATRLAVAAPPLAIEGVHVVPHVQSTEMRYRQKADFSLGARVEVFLRNTSSSTVVLPPDLDVRLRGKTPEEWIRSDEWAWHDLPSAWGGEALRLPPGAVTPWSWNGKRAPWGTNTEAALDVRLPGDANATSLVVPIREPSAWVSALTFLGEGADARPDSMVFHLVNAGPDALRLEACRLWLPESNTTWRALIPRPWSSNGLERFPADGVIAPGQRGGARVATGPLPLGHGAVEIRLVDAAGKPLSVWAHQRIRREAFDISGGWVADALKNGNRPLQSEPFLKTLRRMHVNTAYVQDSPGYTDQVGPDGLYTRYPLKYVGKLEPFARYDSDGLIPRIHAVEFLGEPQYGGGRPVPPQDVWKQLAPYAPTRLPTSLTHSEERIWRFYAGLSDYPHYDAYRVCAPSPDSWGQYDRWNGERLRWAAPLETIGEMTRSLRELNRPRPIAYWAQGAHHDWGSYGGRKRRSPTPDELRLQAYHALSSRITSLYWFNLSARSLVAFPDLIEPITRVGREIRMVDTLYLEGDATSHQRILREGRPDWDLDVVSGPRGALLFALDLAYQPNQEERVLQFGPPRDATFRFPVPDYVGAPAQVLRIDADGVTPVAHTTRKGVVEVRDRVSRVAVYLATSSAGEQARLDARRRQLVAEEEALGFDPGRKPEDLAVLKQLVQPKE